jgi:hypothetical protein
MVVVNWKYDWVVVIVDRLSMLVIHALLGGTFAPGRTFSEDLITRPFQTL